MLRCPHCDSADAQFVVSFNVSVCMDGGCDPLEIEYSTKLKSTDDCECDECGYIGAVSEFITEEE